MLTAGDELGRTQHGNNNAYCQDNRTSWLNWQLDQAQEEFLAFVRQVLALRSCFGLCRRDEFLHGESVCDAGLKDVSWLRCDGQEMESDDWHNLECRTLGMLRHAHADARRTKLADGCKQAETLLAVLHANGETCEFRLPAVPSPGRWVWRLNTAVKSTAEEVVLSETITLVPRSLSLLEYETSCE
jgi:glycogen operon protein